MKALLLTVGSQGDVQPFIALALRLQASGHDAVLAAPAGYSGLAAAYDVPFVPLDLDMSQVGSAVAGSYGLRHMVRFCRAMGRRAAALLPGLWRRPRRRRCRRASSGAATRPASGRELAGARRRSPAAARAGADVGICLGGLAVPGAPEPEPAVLPAAGGWPVRGAGRTWTAGGARCWRCRRGRGRHDPLASRDGAPVTVLHAFSARVVPRPADWPATAHVTGYWRCPPRPAGRRRAGWPSSPRPAARSSTSASAACPARTRSAWPPRSDGRGGRGPGRRPRRGGLAQPGAAAPAAVRSFPGHRDAPHDWLFPRMRAIVHHGGAGTAAAAVPAGRPQVIWPFGVDQPFWARRMASLGVAPPAPPGDALTGRTLAAALDPRSATGGWPPAGGRLGRPVRTEDGTARPSP